MNYLKEEDSELWCVEKKLLTISIEQGTHQARDFVKNPVCSAFWLIDLFLLACGARFFIRNLLLNYSGMHLI